MKRIPLYASLVILFFAIWFFTIRQDLPEPSSYRRTWTGNAVADSSSRKEFSLILQEMTDNAEKDLYIGISGYPISLTELGKSISSAFINTSDHYLRNSANYWEYNLKEDHSGNKQAVIHIYYQETRNQRDHVRKKAGEIAWEIIDTDMTDIEKIRTVYEWVIRNVTYDGFYARHGGYHALKGKAVCQGYALLLYSMLDGLGYNSIIVSGGDHMWNMVELGENWYHLDATYDDIQEGLVIKKHFINYANFMKSDSDMRRTGHTWNRSIFPEAERSIDIR